MKVADIPFNRFLGIRETPDGSPGLLELEDRPEYLNHIGTVHAGAQLALAEAASGQCLMQAVPEFEGQAFAVVRRVEAKFRNPVRGKVSCRAVSQALEIRKAAESLTVKGRALISVSVEVIDAQGTVGLAATVEWFAQRIAESP